MTSPRTRVTRPTVLAVGFGSRPETAVFALIANTGESIERIEDRSLVGGRLRASRPRLLLFPTHDDHGVPMLPLVEQCRRIAEDVLMVVLVGAYSGAERRAAHLARTGALVASTAAPAALVASLSRLMHHPMASGA